MTTREAPAEPVTQEQVQELPRDVSPYLQALVLAYLASGGEESEQTNRRALLFRKALAAAALGAFLFRDRDKTAAADIDFTETAEPFTAAVKDSVGEYLGRGDERDSKTDSKFAESVASTLSTGASNRLTLDVLNQLDPDGKAYKKLWLTRGDEKVRLSHRELHGRTASVGEPFKKGLNYPGDPTAPLDERINCRCFLFAVPSGQEAETANAFEPADLTTAFAASAALHAVTAGTMLRRLMHLAPWTWQPRDSIGRWVEVGDVMHAPASSGKGKERGRVVEVIGRNRVRLESLRFPGRTWDVDSRDTAPDFSKARLGNRPTLPHLQPIPNPRAERGLRSQRLPPEFGDITPEIPHRPVEREIRPPVYGLSRQVAGAPIFESSELAPGKVVVVESKTKPGTFRHMIVDEIGEDDNTVLLLYPPEPRRKSAESSYAVGDPSYGTTPETVEYDRIFQLESPAARQEVFLDEGVLYEPADPQLVEEVRGRAEMSQYGFANPYWFSGTDQAFKVAPYSRTDWVPERKALHDKFIQDEFDKAVSVENPTFYLIGGGTASGKSTILKHGIVPVPQGNQAVQINADDAKYATPEFIGLMEAGHRGAASFVHEESSDISGRMIREVPPDKNVVLDGIANKGRGSVLERLRTARSRGQRVIAHYATLPTEMAVQLSDKRGDEPGPEGGRYVPHDLIRKSHAGVTDTFFDLAKHGDVEELYLWNTEIWKQPRLIFSQIEGVSEIHDESLLLEFLNKSRTKRHSYESVVALTESGFTFPSPVPQPGMHELPTMPVGPTGGEVTGLAAAGEFPVDEDGNIDYGLDWDTMIQVAIEVAAEMTGSQAPSRFPAGDPAIEGLKEAYRAEFAAHPGTVWWLPYDSE